MRGRTTIGFPFNGYEFQRILDISAEQTTRVVTEQFIETFESVAPAVGRITGEVVPFFLRLLSKQSLQLETRDSGKYLQLLCQYQSEEVIEFLKSNDFYRLDVAVNTIKDHGMSTALIYLYGKQGDYLSTYGIAVEALRDAPSRNFPKRKSNGCWTTGFRLLPGVVAPRKCYSAHVHCSTK